MRAEPLKLTPVSNSSMSLTSGKAAPEDEKPFGEFLSEALNEVNELQHASKVASLNLVAGKVQDISEVMVATEKASVALQLTMQVRNKIVDAYQEIMRMQV
ncbi:flagellar hook-basal body complex protein FliE [Acetonema longum]|uniref:Flagellar hook-basal body complex protein FliE n=1 Tax=Acetonema longum DSM 6540 TaxID=1009370 RepID=F7NL39_9FIRM|nr:flagellar hook-basal body complex protein FliE [Acetonema longum]EGO63144.1 flagellar hook-basal body protein FliE [Acetonema longum DSM 6540]